MSNYTGNEENINRHQQDEKGGKNAERVPPIWRYWNGLIDSNGLLAKLSLVELRLLNALFRYADYENLTLYPSLNTLAENLSTSRGNVANAMKRLEAKGFVHIVSKGGGRKKSTVRQLTLPRNAIAGNSVKGKKNTVRGDSVKGKENENAIAGNSVKTNEKRYPDDNETLSNSEETLLNSGENAIAGNRRTTKQRIKNDQTNDQADLDGLDSSNSFPSDVISDDDENKAVETRDQIKQKMKRKKRVIPRRRLRDIAKAASTDSRSSQGDDISAPAAGGTMNQSDDADERCSEDGDWVDTELTKANIDRVNAALRDIGVYADNATARRNLAKDAIERYGKAEHVMVDLNAVMKRAVEDDKFNNPAGFTRRLLDDPKLSDYLTRYRAGYEPPEEKQRREEQEAADAKRREKEEERREAQRERARHDALRKKEQEKEWKKTRQARDEAYRSYEDYFEDPVSGNTLSVYDPIGDDEPPKMPSPDEARQRTAKRKAKRQQAQQKREDQRSNEPALAN